VAATAYFFFFAAAFLAAFLAAFFVAFFIDRFSLTSKNHDLAKRSHCASYIRLFPMKVKEKVQARVLPKTFEEQRRDGGMRAISISMRVRAQKQSTLKLFWFWR
jgi:hypothetical protein